MYVNRLVLRGVKCLRRDLPADGGLPEPAQRRLLLQGANGSGKTTILETIATLWRFLGEWIDKGSETRPPSGHLRHSLADAELVAVEFCGFSKGLPSLWVGLGRANAWTDFRREHGAGEFAGLLNFGEGKWTIELPAIDLKTVRDQSLVGRAPYPNVLHFPPDDRTIRAHLGPVKLLNMQDFNWSAEFQESLSVDSLLMTAKAHDPERYGQALSLINAALRHRQKQLVGPEQGGRHIVQGKIDGKYPFTHGIEELSSGEKQIVLLVAFVACVLRPGGVVLVDEPDLHMHISMVRQLMDSVELVVRERNGQLIVASHSQHVWNWFSRESERVQLSRWRGGR